MIRINCAPDRIRRQQLLTRWTYIRAVVAYMLNVNFERTRAACSFATQSVLGVNPDFDQDRTVGRMREPVVS